MISHSKQNISPNQQPQLVPYSERRTYLNPTRRRGYGIRDVDGEYNDLGDIAALFTTSPVHAHVIKLLEMTKSKKVAKAELAAIAKARACIDMGLEQQFKNIDSQQILSRQEEWDAFKRKEEEMTAKVFKEVEDLRRRQQIEIDAFEKSLSSARDNAALEVKAIEEDERRALERAKIAAAEELERQSLEEQKRKLESEELQRKALAEKQQRERLAAEKLKAEQQKAALELQVKQQQELLDAEKLSSLAKVEEREHQSRRVPPKIGSNPSKDPLVPSEFQGCILTDDLQKYATSQELLEKIQQQTTHITNTSKFYSSAMKVVNAPLNQITAQTQNKISHFTDLLDGRSVTAPGLASQFSMTNEKNGDLFVKNLLAFRFVKKAEADTSENKFKRENLNYLAIVGVSLIKKYPDVGDLIQAHFYKACPFLVPFSYPRNGMDIRKYAAAIGHNINIGGDKDNVALEASITQTLLDKLAGFCMLYGYMVRNMCSQSMMKAKLTNSFLSLKEVWRILSATVFLDPQDEVTATILHSLLEILDNLLKNSYGLQYKKMLKFIKDVYVERIRTVTSKGKMGSLSRLEQLLEKSIH